MTSGRWEAKPRAILQQEKDKVLNMLSIPLSLVQDDCC